MAITPISRRIGEEGALAPLNLSREPVTFDPPDSLAPGEALIGNRGPATDPRRLRGWEARVHRIRRAGR